MCRKKGHKTGKKRGNMSKESVKKINLATVIGGRIADNSRVVYAGRVDKRKVKQTPFGVSTVFIGEFAAVYDVAPEKTLVSDKLFVHNRMEDKMVEVSDGETFILAVGFDKGIPSVVHFEHNKPDNIGVQMITMLALPEKVQMELPIVPANVEIIKKAPKKAVKNG